MMSDVVETNGVKIIGRAPAARFEQIGFAALAIGFILLPIFFLPFWGLPPAVAKNFLLATTTTVAFACWLVHVLAGGRLAVAKSWWWLASVLVLFVTVLSGALALSPRQAFLGTGETNDTVFQLFVFFLVFFLAGQFFKIKERLRRWYFGWTIGFLAFFLWLAVSVIFGSGLAARWFGNATLNPLGAAFDLAVFCGLAVLSALVWLESGLSPHGRWLRWTPWAVLTTAVSGLVWFNFGLLWLLVGTGALCLYLYRLSLPRAVKSSVTAGPKKILTPSLFLCLFSLLLLPLADGRNLLALPVNYLRQSLAAPVSLMVKPSWSSTWSVGRQSLSNYPWFGAGPDHFTSQWLRFKPPAVNQTAWWGWGFETGAGWLPTVALLSGALGLVVWLIWLLTFLFAGWRLLAAIFTKRSDQPLVVLPFIGALYLWAVVFLSAPGSVIIAIAFVLSGAWLGAAAGSRLLPEWEWRLNKRSVWGVGSHLALAVLLFLSLAGFYYGSQRFVARFYAAGSLQALNRADPELAANRLARALALDHQNLYRQLAVEVNLQRLLALPDRQLPSEDLRRAAEVLIGEAVDLARAATTANPFDQSNWRLSGRLFQQLAKLGVTGAVEQAAAAYQQALTLNPNDPGLFHELAVVAFDQNQTTEAAERLEQSLRLKPDFSPALLLSAQLAESRGDLKAALAALEILTASSPTEPRYWFILGSLHYRQADYQAAAAALERAAALNEVYADARYFLGLTYDKLDRRPAALEQFELVSKTNPEREDLRQIIANLRRGAPALTTDSNER